MKISCLNLGKRFNREWIFRDFDFNFLPGSAYAITGPNGSGKSTLLQVVAGALTHSSGSIQYSTEAATPIAGEDCYMHLSFAAPYLDLVEEMTVTEFLSFHQQFKPFLPGISIAEIISMIDLEKSSHKQIRYYSSGMKQRVKLAQAIFSNTFCLMLDEPCTNFDEKGFRLYHELMKKYAFNRLVIVSSNDEQEISFCNQRINILDYKPVNQQV